MNQRDYIDLIADTLVEEYGDTLKDCGTDVQMAHKVFDKLKPYLTFAPDRQTDDDQTDVEAMRQKIQSIEEVSSMVEAVKKNAINMLQDACHHPFEALRECERKLNNYSEPYPRQRVCLVCGLAEEATPYYQVLRNHEINKTVPLIPREELYRYRRAMHKTKKPWEL